MVQPLYPVSTGSIGQIPNLGLRASRPTDIMQADSTRGAVQGATSSASNDTPPLQEVLTQLFQSLGLDTQNSQALQTLVTLLILMAVLQSLTQTSANSAMQPQIMGGSSTDPSEYSAYYSSTTITFEQSTTAIQFGDAASMNDFLASNPNASLGSNIDFSI